MPRPKDTKTQAPKGAAKQSTALALPKGGALSADVLAILGEEASAESGRIASIGSDWISFRGGEFAYNGDALEEPLQMVVVDFAYDNAYYEGQFDPQNPESPACFAISREPGDMRPHDQASDPQGDDKGTCAKCIQNAFGSRGKGKACKNSVRLALVPISTLIDGDPKVYSMRIPPTAMKPYLQYIRNVNGAMKRPVWSVVTDWNMVKKGTYSIPEPTLNTTIDNAELLNAIKTFREGLGDMVLDPGAYLIDRSSESSKGSRRTGKSKHI